MPYKSKAQLGFMHAKHPTIAKRWDKKYDVPSNLPEKVDDVKARPKSKPRVKKGGSHGEGC
jgi:hypothetical protein